MCVCVCGEACMHVYEKSVCLCMCKWVTMCMHVYEKCVCVCVCVCVNNVVNISGFKSDSRWKDVTLTSQNTQ